MKKGSRKSSPDVSATSLSRDDLIDLFAEYSRCGSKMAEARGKVGQQVKALEEHGFDAKVFNCIRSLIKGKDTQGIRARLATFREYVDIMGLEDQADIEDFIASQPDTRTAMEKAMDGDEVGGKPTKAGKERAARGRRKNTQAADAAAVDDVAAGGSNDNDEAKTKLTSFRKAMSDADSHEAVNNGLAAFTDDNPDLTEDAMEIASGRLEQLASVH